MLLLSVASPASANGRFPGARQVVVAPRDPSTLLLRTTFGQMLTRDAGQTFRWVCEEAIGYGGTQDPAVGITEAGTLINAAYEGTTVSRDGCSFVAPTGLQGRYSTDLTVDAAAPARALVIVAGDETKQPPLAPQLWETKDDGVSFQLRSALPAGFFPQNIDVARGSPLRVYITGLQVGGGKSQPSLLRSDDGGITWAQRDVPIEGANVYLSAVDPLDEKRIYVRVEREPDDELLLSVDGGESYSVLFKMVGGMLGFALSPDGSRIAIGGPAGGVLVANRGEGLFVPASATPVTCLAWAASGLYACGVDELSSGFALGVSADDGKSFAPLLAALGDVCGPFGATTCGATSAYAQLCPGRWPALQATLRVTAGPPVACTAASEGGGGGAAATGGVAGISGFSGAPDGAAREGAARGHAATNNQPTGGCDCAAKATNGELGGGFALAMIALLRDRLRRRTVVQRLARRASRTQLTARSAGVQVGEQSATCRRISSLTRSLR